MTRARDDEAVSKAQCGARVFRATTILCNMKPEIRAVKKALAVLHRP
jgi:hypothetical protein